MDGQQSSETNYREGNETDCVETDGEICGFTLSDCDWLRRLMDKSHSQNGPRKRRKRQQDQEVQLNPAIMDVKGLPNSILYKRISIIANIEIKTN